MGSAKLCADVDALAVIGQIAVGLDPDDFDIDQIEPGIGERRPAVAGKIGGPVCRFDPQPDAIEPRCRRGPDRIERPEFGEYARGKSDAVQSELPPSIRNSAPVVNADSSAAR